MKENHWLFLIPAILAAIFLDKIDQAVKARLRRRGPFLLWAGQNGV